MCLLIYIFNFQRSRKLNNKWGQTEKKSTKLISLVLSKLLKRIFICCKCVQYSTWEIWLMQLYITLYYELIIYVLLMMQFIFIQADRCIGLYYLKKLIALLFSLSKLIPVPEARSIFQMDTCSYINHAILNFCTCTSFSNFYSILQNFSHTKCCT